MQPRSLSTLQLWNIATGPDGLRGQNPHQGGRKEKSKNRWLHKIRTDMEGIHSSHRVMSPILTGVPHRGSLQSTQFFTEPKNLPGRALIFLVALHCEACPHAPHCVSHPGLYGGCWEMAAAPSYFHHARIQVLIVKYHPSCSLSGLLPRATFSMFAFNTCVITLSYQIYVSIYLSVYHKYLNV